jgi:hypothetical protein
MVLEEIKHIYFYGIGAYLRSWNNILNSVMNVLYIASFGLNYYTMAHVRQKINTVSPEDFWTDVFTSNQTVSIEKQQEIYDAIYWLNDGITIQKNS